MCGICGGLSWQRPLDADTLGRMLKTLVHRGPDDEGTHVAAPVALGARRLAVIDVQDGRQPMSNEDGSVHVVQNGEIYNHVELREQLEKSGHRFRTRCDTEVLVHLYEEKGENFLDDLVGMFAVAVWDSRAGKLLLARDRLGQKPLYYAQVDGGLIFASEIKALLATGMISREVDYAALREYLSKLYIGGAATIYKAIRQLPPAHRLVAGRDGLSTQRYWDPWEVRPREGQFEEEALVAELGALLREAVRLRLRSDVPLGCFLSGGIDSAVVTALACEVSPRVKTFTVGFPGEGYDESAPAAELARRLGTEHHEYRLEGGPGDLISRLPEFFDQPFGDSSAAPTYRLSEVTREEVTVALSGDGGDEVFGGYQRYLARRLARNFNRLPGAARKAASALAELLARPGERYGGGFGEKLRRFTAYAEQVEKCPELTRLEYFTADMQEGLLNPEALEAIQASAGDEVRASDSEPDPAEAAMRRDLCDYLPDDILVKVDRASMAVSLEARSPFLDHRVVEFMLGLPAEWKLRGLTGKYLLKRFAADILPAEVINRPKHGFAVPLAGWFRPGGEGRTRLEALSRGPLERLVSKDGVCELLERHATGRADLGEHLWALTMLGLWLEGEGG